MLFHRPPAVHKGRFYVAERPALWSSGPIWSPFVVCNSWSSRDTSVWTTRNGVKRKGSVMILHHVHDWWPWVKLWLCMPMLFTLPIMCNKKKEKKKQAENQYWDLTSLWTVHCLGSVYFVLRFESGCVFFIESLSCSTAVEQLRDSMKNNEKHFNQFWNTQLHHPSHAGHKPPCHGVTTARSSYRSCSSWMEFMLFCTETNSQYVLHTWQ